MDNKFRCAVLHPRKPLCVPYPNPLVRLAEDPFRAGYEMYELINFVSLIAWFYADTQLCTTQNSSFAHFRGLNTAAGVSFFYGHHVTVNQDTGPFLWQKDRGKSVRKSCKWTTRFRTPSQLQGPLFCVINCPGGAVLIWEQNPTLSCWETELDLTYWMTRRTGVMHSIIKANTEHLCASDNFDHASLQQGRTLRFLVSVGEFDFETRNPGSFRWQLAGGRDG